MGAAGSLLTGLGLHNIPSVSARGGNGPSRLIVMVAYGGWDPTWVFDPKPDSDEVDLVPGDVQMFGDLPIWTHEDRPAVTEFFTQWGSQTAVVNGLSVDSLAHESCVKVMLTGRLGDDADLGSRIAAELGSDLALPYLTLSPQAKTYGAADQAGQFGSTNQLMALTTPELGWPAPGETNPDYGLAPSGPERSAIEAYLRGRGQAMASAPHSAASQGRIADYLASLTRAEQLQASARQGGVLSNYELFDETEQPWEHIAGVFAEGLSQVALVQPDLFWDTHGYNAGQGEAYEGFFTGLNAMLAALSANGLLEDTAILALSEMGRTPRHNADGGKDHWAWTSAMLVGPTVNGGRAMGTTDAWLRPNPIDLTTGDTVAEGDTLHAEHLLRGVAEMLGADQSAALYQREALSALCR
jgi:hypothetical protein